ncbi:MAG: 6-bladed beta-propeller, partial [Tannerellaceae bacterium]|nr:6-bladed beta-propeller [Tannerellaceae bacterium]
DYKDKTVFISPRQTGRDYENGAAFELDIIELKQAYAENKLSGRLKEIVASSDEEEANNVFVLFQFF